jgi:dTDP-4-amino-4,6-dideoxygalactose transaminase
MRALAGGGPVEPRSQTVTGTPLRIPFNRPTHTRLVDHYVAQALHSGHISGDGDFTRRCQELLSTLLGQAAILLTTSGTHALELMALLLDVGPGDEVIVPSFTFSSTVNAFVLRGATPVFIDIRRDTLNFDETKLEALITPRTRAIVPVHYAGVGCEMDLILDVAERHGVAVVEDNAHGLFGSYRGRPLGTFGVMAAQSFHETKNFSCGEGGAIVINDAQYVERAEIIREKGTNRRNFFRGLVDKYTWVDLGSSYLPSDLLAAMLLAQLEDREWVWEHRSTIWNRYAEGLADWSRINGVQLPFVPEHCQTPYHLFHMVMPSAQSRDALISHLRAAGILAVFHYQPLHLSPFGHRIEPNADCPVTEEVSERLIRLPFYTNMDEADTEAVVETVCGFAVEH